MMMMMIHGLWLGHGEDDEPRTYGWVLGVIMMTMMEATMSMAYGWAMGKMMMMKGGPEPMVGFWWEHCCPFKSFPWYGVPRHSRVQNWHNLASELRRNQM